jgi:hypothetical protein
VKHAEKFGGQLEYETAEGLGCSGDPKLRLTRASGLSPVELAYLALHLHRINPHWHLSAAQRQRLAFRLILERTPTREIAGLAGVARATVTTVREKANELLPPVRMEGFRSFADVDRFLDELDARRAESKAERRAGSAASPRLRKPTSRSTQSSQETCNGSGGSAKLPIRARNPLFDAERAA